jgi:hypothetical protein
MGPCIVQVMVAGEWHGNAPHDLVTVSLCIQIAIDKMQLGFFPLLMPAHTKTLQPPLGILFTMLTSANRSPPQRHACGLQL